MNKPLSKSRGKTLVWLIVTCLTLVGVKVFQVTILCIPIFGVIIWMLCQLLLIVPLVLAIIYLRQQFKTAKFLALIPLAIATLTTLVVYLTDPIVTDFYIYLPMRQSAIDGALATQNAPNQYSLENFLLGKVQVKKEVWGTQVTFPRYTIGMGDGGADYIYRSDDRDISITREEYQKTRTTPPKFPVPPTFKQIRRITNHWFWQEEEW
ncbi:hypothetical protein TUMEXPCC7403_06250 [Tumidithrix helvetica PCC 7403]|uniref:hypothetical protein n=1 Tax=Tumidithrix helvetica TaxID=3457545 RepID=UPI003C8D9776